MTDDEIATIRSALRYDPETGSLHWIRMLSKNVLPGREAGSPDRNGHLVVQVNKKRYMAHRLAWLLHYGDQPSGVVDHINGETSDNRISNLRVVTTQVNQQNRRTAQKNSKSGLLGASLHRHTGRWMAQIKTPSGSKYLGLFDTAESAHQAYVDAKRQLHEGCTI